MVDSSSIAYVFFFYQNKPSQQAIEKISEEREKREREERGRERGREIDRGDWVHVYSIQTAFLFFSHFLVGCAREYRVDQNNT